MHYIPVKSAEKYIGLLSNTGGIIKQSKGKSFDKSKDYSNNFVVETKEEKLFKERIISNAP